MLNKDHNNTENQQPKQPAHDFANINDHNSNCQISENSDLPYFENNQVIWAKIVGYPWWPGKIKQIIIVEKEADDRSSFTTNIIFTIQFLGDSTRADLDSNKVMKYCENRQNLITKAVNFNKKFDTNMFKLAVQQADILCKNNQKIEGSSNDTNITLPQIKKSQNYETQLNVQQKLKNNQTHMKKQNKEEENKQANITQKKKGARKIKIINKIHKSLKIKGKIKQKNKRENKQQLKQQYSNSSNIKLHKLLAKYLLKSFKNKNKNHTDKDLHGLKQLIISTLMQNSYLLNNYRKLRNYRKINSMMTDLSNMTINQLHQKCKLPSICDHKKIVQELAQLNMSKKQNNQQNIENQHEVIAKPKKDNIKMERPYFLFFNEFGQQSRINKQLRRIELTVSI